MANWYCSREAVKTAADINGSDKNPQVDRIAGAVARYIDRRTHRFFIPRTETRFYRWPPSQISASYVLWLDQGLLSVTQLQSRAQDAAPIEIEAGDYYLEPVNQGPPYSYIELDFSTSTFFESGVTVQRAISVAGDWGYNIDTAPAGSVVSGLASDATATQMICADGSRAHVGDTLLIENERVFVAEKTSAAEPNGDLVNSAEITLNAAYTTITVDDGTRYHAGEVIQIDSEQMFVDSIAGNVLNVKRAWNGTANSEHANDTPVYVFRVLTIERGVNGTTAATHANATAMVRHVPPDDIVEWALAEAISMWNQEESGWGRTVGSGDNQREYNGRALSEIRRDTTMHFYRARSAAI